MMYTYFLNYFNDKSLDIIKNNGDLNSISIIDTNITDIICSADNQVKRRDVSSIEDVVFDRLNVYFNRENMDYRNYYNYFLDSRFVKYDVVSFYVLLQATAVIFDDGSFEEKVVLDATLYLLKKKIDYLHHLGRSNDIFAVLEEVIDVEDTLWTELFPLISQNSIHLSDLVIGEDKRIVLTYDDFINSFGDKLEGQNSEHMFGLMVERTWDKLILAIIELNTCNYIAHVRNLMREIEPSKQILDIAGKIKHHIHENMPYLESNITVEGYVADAFPPCIKRALRGVTSGERNAVIVVFLTSFLSFARLCPEVYSINRKDKLKITDYDPTLEITKNEVLPLIYEAAGKCKPPLFKDQPEEKLNINDKLGFGFNELNLSSCGKSRWYIPLNCKSVQISHPRLCKKCRDCEKINTPLTYYIRKKALITKKKEKEENKKNETKRYRRRRKDKYSTGNTKPMRRRRNIV